MADVRPVTYRATCPNCQKRVERVVRVITSNMKERVRCSRCEAIVVCPKAEPEAQTGGAD